jgi:hypothetical protein
MCEDDAGTDNDGDGDGECDGVPKAPLQSAGGAASSAPPSDGTQQQRPLRLPSTTAPAVPLAAEAGARLGGAGGSASEPRAAARATRGGASGGGGDVGGTGSAAGASGSGSGAGGTGTGSSGGSATAGPVWVVTAHSAGVDGLPGPDGAGVGAVVQDPRAGAGADGAIRTALINAAAFLFPLPQCEHSEFVVRVTPVHPPEPTAAVQRVQLGSLQPIATAPRLHGATIRSITATWAALHGHRCYLVVVTRPPPALAPGPTVHLGHARGARRR